MGEGRAVPHSRHSEQHSIIIQKAHNFLRGQFAATFDVFVREALHHRWVFGPTHRNFSSAAASSNYGESYSGIVQRSADFLYESHIGSISSACMRTPFFHESSGNDGISRGAVQLILFGLGGCLADGGGRYV